MSPEARQQLGEWHDRLIEEYQNEQDPVKAAQIIEKIAVIEVSLVASAPISSEPIEGWETND